MSARTFLSTLRRIFIHFRFIELIKRYTVIFGLTAMAACGGGGDSPTASTDSDGGIPASNDPSAVDTGEIAVSAPQEFNGIWVGCHEDGPVYGESVINIQNNSAVDTIYWNSDSRCENRTTIEGESMREAVLSITYLNSFTTTPLGNAQHVNVIISQSIDGVPIATDVPFYTIWFLDGDKMYFGDVNGENDGFSIETRPTALGEEFWSHQ